MRNVVPSTEVAHLWAHQAQESARTSTRNFYFEGDTIYSYGYHFPIARHVTNRRGAKGILFVDHTYSHTTSSHIADVHRAIRGHEATVVYVPKVPGETWSASELTRGTLKDYDKRVAEAKGECFGPTGRFRPLKWGELSLLIGQANAFAEFFLSKRRWTLPETDAIRDIVEASRAREARAAATREKKAAIAHAEYLVKAAAELELWKAGEAGYSRFYTFRDLPIALRVKDNEVETSLGARVPIDHARLALRVVRLCRDTQTPYERNGRTVHIGHYVIDSIDAQGNLRAGCHSITIDEIERIAPLLEQ